MILSRKTPISVQAACRLLGLSRASFYRPQPDNEVQAQDAELEKQAGKYPRFGYRRMALVMGSSPKRMRTRMRRLGLGARRRIRRVRTTFSVPSDALNLCKVALAPGELLVSDFTYIPRPVGFAYFAVTLDVFTRRVRGFHVSKAMDTNLVLSALDMAISSGRLAPNWVHHCDQGVQYVSCEFRTQVQNHQGTCSFSKRACPGDNAFAESFFARFKDESLRCEEITGFQHAKLIVHEFVEFYNNSRPHSSLGGLNPATFEENYFVKLKSD